MNTAVPQTEFSMSQIERIGSDSFRMLRVSLAAGEVLVVEPGAMASQHPNIECETSINGGIIQGLISKFLGKESFFVNYYRNPKAQGSEIHFTQPTPGDIVERNLQNETIFIERGSFIARSPTVRASVSWAGFASLIAGEGLFRLCYQGTGKLWYGAYGAVIERDIQGDLIVDSGHLLSYPPTVKLKLTLAGGLFSSVFSGEGFVLRLSGFGRIQLQTRSVKGLAQWLNPRFWG
jgi:uncharacterized protein (TIGR00266 family)